MKTYKLLIRKLLIILNRFYSVTVSSLNLKNEFSEKEKDIRHAYMAY
jgi:hypothetical protein